MTIAGNGR
jgi:hypothetical protein